MRFRPWLLALALAAAGCARPPANADGAVDALIERIGHAELVRQPEQADVLGITQETFGGPYASLLNDRSIAATERGRVTRVAFLHDLETLDRTTLSRPRLRRLNAVTYVYDAAARLDRYGYGYVELGWASPYLINQSDGAYADLMKFMTFQHPIRSRSDADAWLARLRQIDDAVRDERRRFEIDIANGAAPPRNILQRTLDKVRALTPADPRENMLTLYLAEQLSQLPDLPEQDIRKLVDDAAKVMKDEIRPAYAELAKALEAALKDAADEPGVWRLKNGEAYYRDALRFYTTTEMTPDEIHSVGLKMVEQLTQQMDAILVETGRTEGTVGERMAAMGADPANHYPETEEGRAALVAALRSQIDWAKARMGRMVSDSARRDVEIRQAPQIVADTAPGAYYKAAALDGLRPATYNLNLGSTLDWPIWSLPTLTFHEAIPGHHVQAGAARERWTGPVLSLLITHPAFSEGWAVYGEDLANEMGAYASDPAGKLGYLQSLLFRAARMVVDTGIHAKKWTRAQATDYLVSTTGLSRASMENEVDRYIIWPGQACAYMIGREKIRNLRESADLELGPDFDLRAFHDAVLAEGARPLGILEADIQDWVVSRKRGQPVAQKSTP